MELEKVAERDLAEVASFLCSVFGIKGETRNFSLDLLRWKYFSAHPYWEGSRSYCIRQSGEIVAHGCIVPNPLLIRTQPISCCSVIDWAGSPKAPGAGGLCYQGLFSLTEIFLGIGGSKTARKMLPRLGLEAIGDLDILVRVVRPLRDFAQRPKLNWRSGAHLARNTIRLLPRLGATVPKGWTAKRVQQFDETVQPVLSGTSDTVVFQRNPAFLNYLLACPAVRMEGYTFHSGYNLVGYCLLSRYENKCHIADLRSDNLPGAYALALQLAADAPETAEVFATASTVPVGAALHSAGFHKREAVPMFSRDLSHLLDGVGPISTSSVENDFFYL